ncbi:MAG: MATE family efflux transporter [Cytophagales bacterium]|nr:MATE family efflux transporter [Armatimonadota bacterium]
MQNLQRRTLNPSAPPAGAPPIPDQAVSSIPEGEAMAEESVNATRATADRGPGRAERPVSEAEAAKAAERRAVILEGPIGKGVLKIALPSVATMMLQTTNSFLDRFFVGSLGTEALAAVTVGSSLMFALMSAAMAISVGTTALVARSVGEGNLANARTATTQSLLIALIASVLIGVPMLLLRVPLLSALGLDDAALRFASQYLFYTVLGLPTLFLMLTFNGAFRGLGDTVRPLWVTVGAIAIHASFNWLLIFGKWGFPKMGLGGGALALVLSQLVATVLYLVFLRRTPLSEAASRRTLWRPDWEWIRRIGRIGLPASAQQLIRVGSMLGLQSLLAHTSAGSAAVAALGVGLLSESIAFMPGFGYAIAASAFVGQNLGAGKVERANSGGWIAAWQAVAVMTFMGGIFYFAAAPFAHLFVRHDPNETAAAATQVETTIALTILYLRIAAFSEPFLGLGMVLTGALQGAGETVSPTILTIVTMVLIRVPLAYFLAFFVGMGPVGAWWAMSLSTVLQGILTADLFRRGKWRTVRV